MLPSNGFFELVKKFEGLSLIPYLDPVGIATIGYGTTFYPDGKKVTMKDKAITASMAEQYIMSYMDSNINQLNKLIKISLTQNQFDAICDFVYNLGITNFKSSSLLKSINNNSNDDIIKECFLKWVNIRINGVLKKMQGLINRRNAEIALYFKK